MWASEHCLDFDSRPNTWGLVTNRSNWAHYFSLTQGKSHFASHNQVALRSRSYRKIKATKTVPSIHLHEINQVSSISQQIRRFHFSHLFPLSFCFRVFPSPICPLPSVLSPSVLSPSFHWTRTTMPKHSSTSQQNVNMVIKRLRLATNDLIQTQNVLCRNVLKVICHHLKLYRNITQSQCYRIMKEQRRPKHTFKRSQRSVEMLSCLKSRQMIIVEFNCNHHSCWNMGEKYSAISKSLEWGKCCACNIYHRFDELCSEWIR